MNKDLLNLKCAGLVPWARNYGDGMETRTEDGVNWYDLSINRNSAPHEGDLVIIVTAWMGQLKWLKSVLSGYRRSGAYVILAYDNPFYAWADRGPHQIERGMHNMEHYLLANCMVNKHITYDADKRNGWFWNMRYAQGLIKQFSNFKYVYFTNGDCAVDNPAGFRDLINLLGPADLMAGQSHPGYVHTADVLCRIDAFHKIFDLMAEWMRVPVVGSRSPEGMLAEACAALNIQVKDAPLQPLDPKDGTVDAYARYGQPSTFKDLIGFRNIFAEYETAGNEGRELMQFKPYVDNYSDWIYWGGEERETICRYWETGDRRYLMQFWDRWEDSDYNRLYMPIEYYGKEPIYGSNA